MSKVKVTPSTARSCSVETPLLAESAHSNVDMHKNLKTGNKTRSRHCRGGSVKICVYITFQALHFHFNRLQLRRSLCALHETSIIGRFWPVWLLFLCRFSHIYRLTGQCYTALHFKWLKCSFLNLEFIPGKKQRVVLYPRQALG